MPRPAGLLVVVSGPSGVGKDTVLGELRDRLPDLTFSISATTRPPRPGERDGEAYFFIDPATFAEREERGEFLEAKTYHGHRYGTPRTFVEEHLGRGRVVVAKPEVHGAMAIARAYPGAVLVFLLPDRLSRLGERLAGRASETPAQIARRLAIAAEELTFVHRFDYAVVNGQSDPGSEGKHACDQLAAIIVAERAKIARLDDDTLTQIRTS